MPLFLKFIVMSDKKIISIDIGGTKISGAIFSIEGNMSHFTKLYLDGRYGDEAGKLVIELLDKLISDSGKDINKIHGIGISVPGIIYSEDGTVWAPNIEGWVKYPLLNTIKRYLNNSDIQVCIESDRTCYLCGELWQGAAKGSENVVYIGVGTGIGVGIMVDSKLLHGFGDIAGSVGWMALQIPYSEEYDKCGCFEYYASGNGICNRAIELIKQSLDYQGFFSDKVIEDITTKDIFEAYYLSDPIATKVINKAIQFWGMASANIVSLLNPEKIIWGGGVFGPALKLIPEIYKEACMWAQPISIKQVEYLPSGCSGEAGLKGAAYLVLKHIKYGKQI
jgi:glucokinase